MLLINKTYLLHNLQAVCNLLYNPINNNCFHSILNTIPTCIYTERYALKKFKVDNQFKKWKGDNQSFYIRIWKTKSLCDWWYDDHNCNDNFIGAIDYEFNEKSVKIDYINLYDDEYDDSVFRNPSKEKLTISESKYLISSMINYVKKEAEKNNKETVILGVHSNLRLYKKYFESEGFIPNGFRDSQNPYWIETEFSLVDNDFPIK